MIPALTRWTTRVFEAALIGCLALMALLVFSNVVLRYAFDSGLAWSEELARLLFVWLIFLGAVHASRQHAHLGFDSLVRRLPAAGRKVAIVLNGALMMVACGFFVAGGWQQTMINVDNSYPVLGISYAWLHGVSLVFGIGAGISIALNVREAWLRPQDPDAMSLTREATETLADVPLPDEHGAPR